MRIAREDITQLEVDAFVFYAQPDLALGSGVGRVISARGGASIQKELAELAKRGPVPTGECVVTSAGKLPAKHIIHAVGPRFREADTEDKLLRTMATCFRRVEDLGAASVAFPAMGAGYYGVLPGVSAKVMLDVITAHLEGTTGLTEVIICVFDTPHFNAVQAAMAAKL